MIKFLLLFLLPLSLYASKILSFNIYDKKDKVDIILTFDTPYNGVIKQKSNDSNIIIKLEDVSIESPKIKKLSSSHIKSITITQIKGYTEIIADVPPLVNLEVSKTPDAYALRLRFIASPPLSNSLQTKENNEISQNYYIFITLLILAAAILFYMKKRVSVKQSKDSKQENFLSHINSVSIRFQKSINSQNSVVMLDFGEQSYLILIGKSNILLDKFTQNRPVTESEFNSILQKRQKEIDAFFSDNKDSKEYLQSYKEKAASLRYES
ncbi:MAG: hypothetical protein C0628_02570 [Sulfurimonas sp.]|nr:MAG: hypothetical protein C0628_02570 [Sulfurimonas sp.]